MTNYATEEIIADKLRHNEIRPIVAGARSKKKLRKDKDKDADGEKDDDMDLDDYDSMIDNRSITDKSRRFKKNTKIQKIDKKF